MKQKSPLRLLPVCGLIAALGIFFGAVLLRQNSATDPALARAERTVKAHAKAQGISWREYPKSLIELLARNPETEEFVLNYPFYESLPVDLSGYDRASVPLFLQWDSQWGYQEYGSDMIAITGCGPTCLAMAGYYLTGEDTFSPDQVAAFSEEQGHYAAGYGSSWTLISQGGPALGLEVTELPLVESLIADSLAVGKPVICAMGPGDFTASGHFIVLVGYENGVFRINDPNSRENSEKSWSYDRLSGQIRNLWSVG